MARGPAVRPRSSTSVSSASTRPRPLSPASTTGAHTVIAQSAQQGRHRSETSFAFAAQNGQNPSVNTLEEPITQSEQHLTNPTKGEAIDPSLQDHGSQITGLEGGLPFNGLLEHSRPPLSQFESFNGNENHSFMSVGEQNVAAKTGMTEGQKKPTSKGNASSQANDQELRRLFRENNQRDLKEVAASVIANERGPKSEKTKQIFAMNWLSTTCKTSNSAVPRSVVYSHYVNRCGTERVPVLNPASFGKLVRIIFPNVQTRRLGMRGSSKYHYVDLGMIPEQIDGHQGEGIHRNGGLNGVNTRPPVWRSQFPADTAVFPSPNGPFDPHFPHTDQRPKMDAVGLLYLDHHDPVIHPGPSRPNMVSRMLQFPASNVFDESEAQDDSPIELPSLLSYLPPGTDSDAATSLRALYRSHCISIIDNFRHCKEKTFWRHFTSFHGTLTVPVQKLFAHPDVAQWIKECDWLMYQKMIRFASPRALEFLPERAINSFHSIATNLGPSILNVFKQHPQHVRDARYGPAIIFSGLLKRLLRLQRASVRAIETLSNVSSRDSMWYDWVYVVDPCLIAETCLPGAGYTRTIQILTNDIRELLGPLSETTYPGMHHVYAIAAADESAHFPQFPDLDDSPSGSALERWAYFLQDLASRFPSADPRMVLNCVNAIGGAALRDLTLANAESFGHWAILKCWIDEAIQWLAEVGGFLDNRPSSIEMRPQKRSAREAGFEMNHSIEGHGGSRPRTSASDAADVGSRYGGVDTRNDFSREHTAHGQATSFGPSAPHANEIFEQGHSNPQQNLGQHPPIQHEDFGSMLGNQGGQYQQEHKDSEYRQPCKTNMPIAEEADRHDDSGIGLDFDLPPQPTFTPSKLADYAGLVAGSTNGGSDPADVVVC